MTRRVIVREDYVRGHRESPLTAQRGWHGVMQYQTSSSHATFDSLKVSPDCPVLFSPLYEAFPH